MRVYLLTHHPILKSTITDRLSDDSTQVVEVPSVGELPEKLGEDYELGDLIIADLTASDSEELAVLKEVHARFPDAPLVAMTDSSEVLPVDEAMSCGIHAYLRKPIRLPELELVVRRLTTNSSNGSNEQRRVQG